MPDELLPPEGTLGFRVQKYGMRTWGDLFTARQKLALVTLARAVRELPASVPEAVRLAMTLVVNRYRLPTERDYAAAHRAARALAERTKLLRGTLRLYTSRRARSLSVIIR